MRRPRATAGRTERVARINPASSRAVTGPGQGGVVCARRPAASLGQTYKITLPSVETHNRNVLISVGGKGLPRNEQRLDAKPIPAMEAARAKPRTRTSGPGG